MKKFLFSFSFTFIFVLSTLWAGENVGYYIGSFDPPTLGHKAVLEAAMKAHNLSKVYITVNYNTDKDFNASMPERLEMLRRLFAEYGDRVVILREPLEGRPAFARYLLEKHQGKVLGIFGDDTYEKNYKIFTKDADVHDFDYIKVKRPEVSGLESTYQPITHDLEIDADGTSSSLARKLILEGKDPVAERVLSREVMNLIHEKKLYYPLSKEEIAANEENFKQEYKKFIEELARLRPDLKLSLLKEPLFKSTQSREAEKDKFIRHVVNGLKMPLQDELIFRVQAEKILQLPFETRPLRSSEKAGIYIGSFDGPNPAQISLIENVIKSQKLDRLYVGALKTSRKKIVEPLQIRISRLKELTKRMGGKVEVFGMESLDSSPSVFRALRNEHSEPTLAIFGDNVFDANYERLKGISNLQFGYVERKGAPARTLPLPPNTVVLGNEMTEALTRRILDPSFQYDKSGKIKVAFFDADSTLRVAPSGNVSANGERDVWILPLVSQEIARLKSEGYLIAIISNQGGIPKSISLEAADQALNFTRKMIRWLNPEAVIHYHDFAEFYDGDRKPGTGMLERLEKELKKQYGQEVQIDKKASFYCGDSAYKNTDTRPDGKPGTDFSNSDRAVAENFKIPFEDPADRFHWRKYGVERFKSKAEIDAFYKAHPELKQAVKGPCPFLSLIK